MDNQGRLGGKNLHDYYKVEDIVAGLSSIGTWLRLRP